MTESMSGSQYLSSSRSSLTPSSKKASQEVSKIYKHASQLYLTRRLADAYEILQPLITPSAQSNGQSQSDDDAPPAAPIAAATTSQRIKIWSLYITLLNAIVDLGLEEGNSDFGAKEYRNITKVVRSGDIWEQVVQNGYRGREGSVDAEVVYNLATLLLGQAATQTLNQSRLETYLSSSSQPDLDVSSHLNRSPSRRSRSMNGADTPKDLTSRLRILELFTLHVLPKNEEWDYARSFISNSDILDDDRRDAFLTTLEELQQAKDSESFLEDEEDVEQEREDELKRQQAEAMTKEAENATINGTSSEQYAVGHRRSNSEVDYGIDKSHPISSASPTTNGHSATKQKNSSPPQKRSSTTAPAGSGSRSQLSPPVQTPKDRRIRKPAQAKSNDAFARARHLYRALQNLARNISGAITSNPTVLFRMMIFVLAFLMALSRKEIRDRARRIVGASWDKVRGTVGMGVKISYI